MLLIRHHHSHPASFFPLGPLSSRRVSRSKTMSSSPALHSLRRSCPSAHRICQIYRTCGGSRSYSSTPAPAAYAGSSGDRDIGDFAKLMAGVVAAGSALAMWSLNKPASTGAAHEEDIKGKRQTYLFGDAYRKKVFFNYEKRIRLRSPPEKVFEYFASYCSPEGELYMTPADLMRAVIPVFPPSGSNIIREGCLRGEHPPGELYCSPSNFFMLFDTDNDGFISFSEYIFFVTLLSIPESSFSVAFKMFDLDNNGEIDREEFKKVMSLMRSYNRQGVSHRDGMRVGLKIGKSVENGGLIEYFFGKDGSGHLHHDKFVDFLRNLHDEMLWLEFNHYDYKLKGAISAKDFALSMVASAEIGQISKLLDRVDEIEKSGHLQDKQISLEEFKAFAELRSKLKPLAFAIFSYGKVNGLLTKPDFQRAASHVCGISLSDNVVDVIYHVFDSNRDGSLSAEEFLNALQRRDTDIRQPTTGLLSCWINCARSCLLA